MAPTKQEIRDSKPGRFGGPPRDYTQTQWNRSCNRGHSKVYAMAQKVVPRSLKKDRAKKKQWVANFIEARLPLIKAKALKADRDGAAKSNRTLQDYLLEQGSNGRRHPRALVGAAPVSTAATAANTTAAAAADVDVYEAENEVDEDDAEEETGWKKEEEEEEEEDDA